MRILLLMQWFDPEPAFKGLPFAKELARRGHEVQVLTGFPNYPEGKLYPGYRLRPWQRETIDGISVIRVPLYPSHDNSGLRRALNYLSFGISATILAPLLVNDADVVYAYHAPATIAMPAMALKLLRRIPFVYDVNDLWPDSLAATGMLNNRFLLACVALWSRLTYRAASRVVVGTPGMKEILHERGVPRDKVDVVYNWCDEVQLAIGERSPPEADEPELQGRFNVVFAGNMGLAQALDAVLDAAALIAPRFPAVQFVFVGGGVDTARLRRLGVERGLTNVIFLPRRPASEVAPLLRQADVLLVHLRDDPLFRFTLPSKTQAYLAVGRPILMGVAGDASDLVERAGAGIRCAPEDAEGIARAVESFMDMGETARAEMGQNGAQYYWSELSLSVGTERFERLFESAAAHD